MGMIQNIYESLSKTNYFVGEQRFLSMKKVDFYSHVYLKKSISIQSNVGFINFKKLLNH